MLLLVKISPRMSRKVALPEVPELVEELQNILKEKLQLQGSFTLQYEDSDFNMLCVIWLISMISHLSVPYCTFFGMRQLHLLSKSPTVGSESSMDTASVSSRESVPSPSACQVSQSGLHHFLSRPSPTMWSWSFAKAMRNMNVPRKVSPYQETWR